MRNRFTAKLSFGFLAALFLVGLLPAPAHAWGNEGHRVVARIAARHLTARTRAAVLKLLDADLNDSRKCMANESLEERLACVSIWADEARGLPEFRSTVSQHFVVIPVFAPAAERQYNPKRDCPREDCIVTAIAQNTAFLSNPANDEHDRALALKFLIHFIGDLHQPLHVGSGQEIDESDSAKTDFGGNRRLVKWFGQAADSFGCLNLHSLWDEEILTRRNKDDKAYADALNNELTTKIPSFQKGSIIDWTNESYNLAVEVAYGALPQPSLDEFCDSLKGTAEACAEYSAQRCDSVVKRNRYNLATDYYNKAAPVVDLQLSRAGIRLAKALNDIFDSGGSKQRY